MVGVRQRPQKAAGGDAASLSRLIALRITCLLYTSYITQIAFSGAEDFIEKYKDKTDAEAGIIGHFGLGFYSAFMVSDSVEIDTLSYPVSYTHLETLRRFISKTSPLIKPL